jgi:hypothetical protein
MATIDPKTKEFITAERETFQKRFGLEDLETKWAVEFMPDDVVKVAIVLNGRAVYEKCFPITESKFVFRMDYPDAAGIPKGDYLWDFGIAFGAELDDDGRLVNCRDFAHPILTAKYTVREAAA